MRVFVAITNPYQLQPYIYTLIDAIRKVDPDVEIGWGMKNFWSDSIYKYQIVHIHWPHVLLEKTPETHDANEVECRLLTLKENGIKIVTTCHNLEPHYWPNEDVKACYKIAYGLSDTIIHLGDYSRKLFEDTYPKASNVLVYHHVYDTVYKANTKRKKGLEVLHLNKKNRYIICLGAFRDFEERNIILQLGQSLQKTNIYILAPSFSKKSNIRTFVQLLKDVWGKYVLKYHYHILYNESGFVEDEELPYYYSVSDIALIHRKKILNSGNVFMAMYMGKAIIGPDVGNVGELLRMTGNQVFNPQNFTDLKEKVLALLDNCHTIGTNNFKFAMKNLKTEMVAAQLYRVFCDLLK